MDAILALVMDKPRPVEGKFLMSVDHCFAVKGHGTVLTGTVLQVIVKSSLTIGKHYWAVNPVSRQEGSWLIHCAWQPMIHILLYAKPNHFCGPRFK